ncbi:MAG: toll/interleukin-1 receptor domain-containing protein, partial [Planctomycetaceae bacterium]|nr:toll/interleukin-1 receptor domain-containing protein [Planctomycetaceae bacterium]
MAMEKRDFFISYNKADKAWVKWIAGVLEENGYSTYLQAWDIRPGDDFIAKMNEFLENSMGYISVFSQDFKDSPYCQLEL